MNDKNKHSPFHTSPAFASIGAKLDEVIEGSCNGGFEGGFSWIGSVVDEKIDLLLREISYLKREIRKITKEQRNDQ